MRVIAPVSTGLGQPYANHRRAGEQALENRTLPGKGGVAELENEVSVLNRPELTDAGFECVRRPAGRHDDPDRDSTLRQKPIHDTRDRKDGYRDQRCGRGNLRSHLRVGSRTFPGRPDTGFTPTTERGNQQESPASAPKSDRAETLRFRKSHPFHPAI
jgi:hypothetical protein